VWYVQEQEETTYLPVENNYCVTAEYTIYDEPTFWGYTIKVDNQARDVNGNLQSAILGADPKGDITTAELVVAPDFLPTFLGGPYWVVAYDEAEGYALVSNGAPTVPTENGLCVTSSPFSGGGLWIFTRRWQQDQETADLVEEVRGMAEDLGFDTSRLNSVDQTVCGWSE